MENIGTELPYDIGDTLPENIMFNKNKPLTDPANPIFGGTLLLPTIIDGIEYYYNSDYDFTEKPIPSSVVHMIIIRDTNFVTPEGLRAGQRFSDALYFSNGEVIRHYGAKKVYVILPSGWNAAYRAYRAATDTIPYCGRNIEFFFKASSDEYYDHTRYEDNFRIKVDGYDPQPGDSEKRE